MLKVNLVWVVEDFDDFGKATSVTIDIGGVLRVLLHQPEQGDDGLGLILFLQQAGHLVHDNVALPIEQRDGLNHVRKAEE